MPVLFQSLGDKDADSRTASAYALSLAAPLAKFAEAAPEAFRRLAAVVKEAKPKKRDSPGKVAMENAVSALLNLCKYQLHLCPPDIGDMWQLGLSKLPLKEDFDEAKKTHEMLVDLVLASNDGVV